jgi:hypothetical protein
MYLPGNYGREVQAIQTQWLEAVQTGSADRYSALMTDDFFCVNIEGTLMKREEFLSTLRETRRKIIKMSVGSVPLTRIYGETAIINIVAEYEAVVDGIPFIGPFLMTGVFVRMDGVWKTACYHTSDLRVKAAFESRFKRKMN